jgi:hypothetical protein
MAQNVAQNPIFCQKEMQNFISQWKKLPKLCAIVIFEKN